MTFEETKNLLRDMHHFARYGVAGHPYRGFIHCDEGVRISGTLAFFNMPNNFDRVIVAVFPGMREIVMIWNRMNNTFSIWIPSVWHNMFEYFPLILYPQAVETTPMPGWRVSGFTDR